MCFCSVAISSTATNSKPASKPTTKNKPAAKTQNKDIAGAKNVLQKLLGQEPPIIPLTNPNGKQKKAKKKPLIRKEPVRFTPFNKTKTKQKLLPEGYYIADRRGRLIITNNNYPVFVFESDGKALADPPIKLLPNSWLEKMESDVAASSEPIIFRISGEVTCYHNQNFLLLRKVLIEREISTSLK